MFLTQFKLNPGLTDTVPLSQTEEVNQATKNNNGENDLVVPVVVGNESKVHENMDIVEQNVPFRECKFR